MSGLIYEPLSAAYGLVSARRNEMRGRRLFARWLWGCQPMQSMYSRSRCEYDESPRVLSCLDYNMKRRHQSVLHNLWQCVIRKVNDDIISHPVAVYTAMVYRFKLHDLVTGKSALHSRIQTIGLGIATILHSTIGYVMVLFSANRQHTPTCKWNIGY